MAQFKLQQDASSQQRQYMQCIHMRIYNSKERTMVEFSEKSYVLNVRYMMSFFRYSLPISYTYIYICVWNFRNSLVSAGQNTLLHKYITAREACLKFIREIVFGILL